MSKGSVVDRLRASVKDYADFPKAGILFKDMMPMLQDPQLTRDVVGELVERVRAQEAASGERATAVVGLDARGFLLGPWLASQLNLPFVPVRKAGKLPGPTQKMSYTKEYGEDTLELQSGVIGATDKVVILDDLLATGGTMGASVSLVRATGASVALALVLFHLTSLNGTGAFPDTPFNALVSY